MDDKSRAHDHEMVWLKDDEGNSYWLRRDAIEQSRVTDEVRADIQGFLEDDTRGYGDAFYLLDGVIKHWGMKEGQEGYEGNFDLDRDGYIGAADYEIAKKAWVEQYGKRPPVSQPTNAPTF